jgi:hypothetical protein
MKLKNLLSLFFLLSLSTGQIFASWVFFIPYYQDRSNNPHFMVKSNERFFGASKPHRGIMVAASKAWNNQTRWPGKRKWDITSWWHKKATNYTQVDLGSDKFYFIKMRNKPRSQPSNGKWVNPRVIVGKFPALTTTSFMNLLRSHNSTRATNSKTSSSKAKQKIGTKHYGSGAGIVPYIKENNKIYFLLGLDGHRKTLGLTDFGGKADKGETLQEAAAREGHEETMGYFSKTSNNPGSKANMNKGTKFFLDRISNGLMCHRTGNGAYGTYFVNVSDIVKNRSKTISDLKKIRNKMNKHSFKEKIDFKWVESNDLFNANQGTRSHINNHLVYTSNGIKFYGHFVNTLNNYTKNILGLLGKF